jgi:hypothetical protein
MPQATAWTCPECRRGFGRRNQSHTCAPAMSLEHSRIVKTWRGPGQRSAYFVDLRAAEDVDDDVRDWLTEAYLTSPT